MDHVTPIVHESSESSQDFLDLHNGHALDGPYSGGLDSGNLFPQQSSMAKIKKDEKEGKILEKSELYRKNRGLD